jgi:predicted dehydrogenase
MNLRHNPVYGKLHEIGTGGQLGQIFTIESNEYYKGGRSYFRRWNRLRKLSGGLWITKCCHDFDLLNWIGGGKPIRVFATSSLSFYKPKPEGATHCRVCPIKQQSPDYYNVESPPDQVQDALLAMTEQATGQPRDLCLYNSDRDTFDNGIAVIDYDNDVRTAHTLSVVSARDTRQMRIMGTHASAEADAEEGMIRVWHRYGGSKVGYDLSQLRDSGHGGADDEMLLDFFRCCRTGDKPRSSWIEGRLNTQIGLAARQSADTGKPVNIGG